MATPSGGNRQRDMGQAMSREAEEIVIGPLLARANLLRVRGQWNEAIAACTDALRKAPKSVATHSLLAQIYEAQNRPEEAITWYSLSLELDPNNAIDRARWERLTQMQRVRLKAQAKPEPVVAKTTLVIVREKTIERSLVWIDRLFPPGQSRSIARMIYAVCAVIAALLVVSAIAVYFVILPQNKDGVLPPPVMTNPPVVVPPPILVVPPSPVSGEPSSQASPSRSPNANSTGQVAANPTAPTASPKPSTAPLLTTEDVVLRDDLARAAGGNFQVISAQRFASPMNPLDRETARANPNNPNRMLNLALDVVVATGPVWETTRERVVRTAVQIAYLAFEMDGGLDRVLVKVAISGLNARPVPIFYGELARIAIQGADPVRAGLADLLSRFSALQWYTLPTDGSIREPATTVPNTPPINVFIPR